jgi:hypothetical protein
MKIKKQIEQIEGVELVSKADVGVLLVYFNEQPSRKKALIEEAIERGFMEHKHTWTNSPHSDLIGIRPVCTKLK